MADKSGDVASALGRLRRWYPLLGVGALLAVAAVAAALSSPSVTKVPFSVDPLRSLGSASGPPVSFAPPSAQATGGPPTEKVFPSWLLTVAGYLLAGVCVVVAVVVMWVLVRDRISVRRGVVDADAGATAPGARTEDVVAALDAGLSELSDADRDPRRAVIACWVRLEHAAAAAGTPRELGDSPTDLVLRLLGAHRVSRAVLDRLAETYRQARYAAHDIDDRMRVEAQSALRQIRAELTTPVSTVEASG